MPAWEKSLEKDASELMNKYLTSNIKQVDNGISMKIISMDKPAESARVLEPQLEDVFLFIFRE